jgi:POT family proton-dependent oligopeptide transporter
MDSIAVYGHVFLIIGLFVAAITIVMWLIRGWLNSIIESTVSHYAGEGIHGINEEAGILPKT